MRPEYYRKRWLKLRKKAQREEITHLARHTALSFLDRYLYSDLFDADYINLLCEMATYFDNDDLNNIAADALFGIVIEQLCDDFEELQTETYNRLISQVITFLRQLPQCEELDQRLKQYGLQTQQHLYDRIESIRANSDRRRQLTKNPKKVLLLSRVTIGADVAISSVFCQRLIERFPGVELVLIGSSKLREVYAGNPEVRIQPFCYVRRGNLIERFNAWLDLLTVVETEIKECRVGEVLLFDPDSRLSQLGVLPLIESENYFFFNSRGKDSYPKKISIAELANLWLDTVLGPGRFCYPKVWPIQNHLDNAATAIKKIRANNYSHVITINFGVGGNLRKKLEGDFEEQLILALLQQPNTAILLDRGFGDEERAGAERILSTVRRHGLPTKSCMFSELTDIEDLQGVIDVKCSIGEIAALIAHSDEFIGYDSACQHISAALGRPTYTIFTGSNNVRFIRRWTACGSNISEIIYVDTLSHTQQYETTDIVERILDRRYQNEGANS
jgi:ADP-heptose:LPS heptosyltransferase